MSDEVEMDIIVTEVTTPSRKLDVKFQYVPVCPLCGVTRHSRAALEENETPCPLEDKYLARRD